LDKTFGFLAKADGEAAFELLKPGGWYFEAGWEPKRYDTPPTEWAIQRGFASAEHHVWQYRRVQTAPEQVARRLELARMADLGSESARVAQVAEAAEADGEDPTSSALRMTRENLLIAQKPVV
jgi:hypothetical protein